LQQKSALKTEEVALVPYMLEYDFLSFRKAPELVKSCRKLP